MGNCCTSTKHTVDSSRSHQKPERGKTIDPLAASFSSASSCDLVTRGDKTKSGIRRSQCSDDRLVGNMLASEASFYVVGNGGRDGIHGAEMDDWFVAFCAATNAQPLLFKQQVIDVAPDAVKQKVLVLSDSNGNQIGGTSSCLISSSNQQQQSSIADIPDEEFYTWKRFAFATLIRKDQLVTLDTTFFSLTHRGSSADPNRQFEKMGSVALGNLRKKLPQLLEREECFIYLMCVLSLYGRDETFKKLSPARVRQEFQFSEWSMDLPSWRAGWLSLRCYSWRAAKKMIVKLNAQFDAMSIDDSKLGLSLRFAFIFSKKDGAQGGGMPKDAALRLWEAFLGKKWVLLSEWKRFISDLWDKPTISNDQWDHVQPFAASYPTRKSLLTYFDANTSFWPTLMDAFAKNLIEQEKRERKPFEADGSPVVRGNVIAAEDDGIGFYTSPSSPAEGCENQDRVRWMGASANGAISQESHYGRHKSPSQQNDYAGNVDGSNSVGRSEGVGAVLPRVGNGAGDFLMHNNNASTLGDHEGISRGGGATLGAGGGSSFSIADEEFATHE